MSKKKFDDRISSIISDMSEWSVDKDEFDSDAFYNKEEKPESVLIVEDEPKELPDDGGTSKEYLTTNNHVWVNKSLAFDKSKYGNRFDVMIKKNHNRFKYSHIVNEVLNEEECDWIINTFNDQSNDGKLFVNNMPVDGYDVKSTFEGDKKEQWRKCDIRWIPRYSAEWDWLFQRIDKLIKEVNEKYWNFDLTDPICTEDLQVTHYPPGGMYKKHTDWNGLDPEYSTRKLSFSLQLSEPTKDFSGGGLFIEVPRMQEDMEPKKQRHPYLNKGDMCLFPSFLPHEAIPVESGNRYVIVGWIHGNHFR